jgi:hypothetical protein
MVKLLYTIVNKGKGGSLVALSMTSGIGQVGKVEKTYIPLLLNWGETLISRGLKRCKLVDFPESNKRGYMTSLLIRE